MAILKPARRHLQVPGRLSVLRRWAALGLAAFAAACSTPQPAPVLRTPLPPVVRPEPVKPPPLPQADQNRVALLAPLTGPNAAVGQSIANAANMALLDAGDKRVNLRVYDTGPGAGAAAQRAIAEGARLFLGPLLAGDVREVQGIASANNVPVLSFSNDASLAGGGVYVLGFQPAQAIVRVVSYARGRGVDRFAALAPSGVYGQRAATAFVRAVEASGGRSVAMATYGREPAKMIAAARAVTAYDERTKAAGQKVAIRPDGSVAPVSARLAPVPFQALMIADSGQVAAQFLPVLSRFGAQPGTVVLLGTELWATEPGLVRLAGLNGALFASVPDDRFRSLAARYRERFGSQPSRLASLGYDAMLLVNSLAGSWKLGAAFPRSALNDPEGFAGIDGAFRFAGNGVVERALAVHQIGPGGFATVAAAPKSFAGN